MNPFSVIKQSDGVLSAIKKLRKILFDNFTIKDAEIWLKRLQRQIKSRNKAIRSRRQYNLSIGALCKLETNVGHFKHFRKLILNRHIGMGIQSKLGQRVKWANVESSFKSRVKTGIIVNIRHKDLDTFLEDCVVIFKNKIKKILKEHHALKVNTTVCGEFIKKSNDIEILDLNYFNTKNALIDKSTEITDWFKDNVQDKILKNYRNLRRKIVGGH
ncbi:unnamed protein product [Psylliodes chrysocephalus]|uniref:Uncharacterized protein n=1 Tax=Psylliodes chrysocephalus TaxID=3402493 RepID=A0A9P0CSL2_9CUCU|nr:unnamed protein product [Psylliodes chrysocephala]